MSEDQDYLDRLEERGDMDDSDPRKPMYDEADVLD